MGPFESRSTPGRIRTCDLRIRSPLSENDKSIDNNEKQQSEKSVYTPVYTTDADLQFLVDSWKHLPNEVQQTILQIVKVIQK